MSATCASVKAPTSRWVRIMAPLTSPRLVIGTTRSLRTPRLRRAVRFASRLPLRFRFDVGRAIDHSRPDAGRPRGSGGERHGIRIAREIALFMGEVAFGNQLDLIGFDANDRAVDRTTESDRAPDDRVEDGLHVGWRARYHAQDVGRRALLIERYGQLTVARLHFGEESDVFDRDHGLIREGSEQRDLLIGKEPRRSAPDKNHAGHVAVAEYRHAEARAPTTAARLRLQIVGLVAQNVRDVDDVMRP